MAGNGTIGLEILEDLPDVDAVVIPYGGGGLTVGIASAIRALRPQTRIYTAEPETGAALVAALAAGEPGRRRLQPVVRRRLGQPPRARRMWPRLQPLIDDALFASDRGDGGRGADARRARSRDRRGRRRAGDRGGAGGRGRRRAGRLRSSRAGTSTSPILTRTPPEEP